MPILMIAELEIMLPEIQVTAKGPYWKAVDVERARELQKRHDTGSELFQILFRDKNTKLGISDFSYLS